MYHLRLIKALSYSGIVTATKRKPDVYAEDKATAEKAVATGYFQLVEASEEIPAEEPKEKKPEELKGEKPAEQNGKALEEMTMAELETYAAYHNVSLKGIRSKAAALAKIKETLKPAEPENEVDYGSPTMQELQGET